MRNLKVQYQFFHFTIKIKIAHFNFLIQITLVIISLNHILNYFYLLKINGISITFVFFFNI
jgi:hypothetical protein